MAASANPTGSLAIAPDGSIVVGITTVASDPKSDEPPKVFVVRVLETGVTAWRQLIQRPRRAGWSSFEGAAVAVDRNGQVFAAAADPTWSGPTVLAQFSLDGERLSRRVVLRSAFVTSLAPALGGGVFAVGALAPDPDAVPARRGIRLRGGGGMKVVILGAGAMGCLYGAAFHRAGCDVTLVDVNREHIAAINAKGLDLETRAIAQPRDDLQDRRVTVDDLVNLIKRQ